MNMDRIDSKSENQQYAQTMSFLAKVPIFTKLPLDQHPLLAANVTVVHYSEGAEVIKQGECCTTLFVIKEGEASVLVSLDGKPAKKMVTLKQGDYFGECSLLRDEPRDATVVAASELSCLTISRDLFKELGLTEKLQFVSRKAVVGGACKKVKTKPPSPKTQEQEGLIAQALKDNEKLNTLVNLTDDCVAQIIGAAWMESVQEGVDIIIQGDISADYFYIVQSGSFNICVQNDDAQADVDVDPSRAYSDQFGPEISRSSPPRRRRSEKPSGPPTHVMTVGKGGSFGELALMYLSPRAATVTATEDSEVWIVDRKQFKNILMKVSKDEIHEHAKYLDQVQILNALHPDEKETLARALVEVHFSKDELITQQGEPGKVCYILFEGAVDVLINGETHSELKAHPGFNGAKFFGERALLNAEPRAATVQVTSDIAKTFALDKYSLDLLLGPLEDIIKRKGEGSGIGVVLKCANVKAFADHQEQMGKIKKQDIVKLGLLGTGGFAAVELVKHKKRGDTYALKIVSKGLIVYSGMQEGILNEKNIMQATNSSFIIRLYETYNGTEHLYFLLELAMGGELHSTFNRKGLHGSEDHAKFYAAGTVCAFEHLHERRIIYRDLKPENILFDKAGQFKLTDMGLAKFVIGKTFTTCGTPDYFAPEIIGSSGHTKAVDWWALGILIFEMMTGRAPFESTSPMLIYGKVMKGISRIPFPPNLQGPVGDLIKGLLIRDPCDRLPMRSGGTTNIKTSKWYTAFDWGAYENQSMEAPYKPRVKSVGDIVNHSSNRKILPRYMPYEDDGSEWDKEFASI